MNFKLLSLQKLSIQEFSILFIVSSLWLFPLSASAQVESYDLTILGGRYFDVHSGQLVPNKGIAVRNKRFVPYDPKIRGGASINVTDDQTILPGFVDCHAHYNVRLFKRRREEFEVMPMVYLANGATVTFSCGEFDPEKMQQLRKDIESGKQIGPRLINSGPYFGRARPGWDRAASPEKITQEVDFWAAQGVGGFKAKAISPEHLKALIQAAHQHGLTVTGHLDSGFRNSVNPSDAIDMGIDRVEHFLGGEGMPGTQPAYSSLAAIHPDSREYREIAEKFVKHEVWFDATITAYGYIGERGEGYDRWVDESEFFTPFVRSKIAERKHRPSKRFEAIYQAKQKSIKTFFEMGGKITLGTDHVSDGTYLPGFGIHRELDALVRNGIPNHEALRIATLNGAKALRIDKDHGSIEPGKYADVVIVDGNPLKDIRCTRKVDSVMTRGTIYRAWKLLDVVTGVLGPKDESELDRW